MKRDIHQSIDASVRFALVPSGLRNIFLAMMRVIGYFKVLDGGFTSLGTLE